MRIQAIARWALAALAGVLVWSLSTAQKSYDLVIRNGRIADGSGNPAYFADIAVKDGKIVKIGSRLGPAAQEVDAKGLWVSPAFIDVHTHAENVLELPKAENFLRMGVGSVIVGNCGSSAERIGQFLSDVDKTKVSVNVGTLIGHNTLRRKAMGDSQNRVPTPKEMARMRAEVEAGMAQGALGISTGLIYLPGTFSKTDEIVELVKVASRRGGIYASHMRNESTRIDAAIDELLEVGRKSGARIQLSHIKLGGESTWGRATQILAKLDAARDAGIEITQDQYAYTASSTSISVLIPDEVVEGSPQQFAARIKNPEVRESAMRRMKDTLAARSTSDYGYVVVSGCPWMPSITGKRLPEIAKDWFGDSGLDKQIEAIFKIQASGGAKAVFFGLHESDVETFMKHPNTMIASDSACRSRNEEKPHPRGYGNNARVLGTYVRERGTVRLEDAIRKMTSLPAQTFRIKDRGLLVEGRMADIVVFDPRTIAGPASYDQPHQFSVGIRHLWVNGVETVKNDRHTGARAGKALRGIGFTSDNKSNSR